MLQRMVINIQYVINNENDVSNNVEIAIVKFENQLITMDFVWYVKEYLKMEFP